MSQAAAETTDLRGYTTETATATATIRRPCSVHATPGWRLEHSVLALEHGWPPDHPGSGFVIDCEACQAGVPLRFQKVLGHETNDPRVVGVTDQAEAIIISKPLHRLVYRLRNRGRRHQWHQL